MAKKILATLLAAALSISMFTASVSADEFTASSVVDSDQTDAAAISSSSEGEENEDGNSESLEENAAEGEENEVVGGSLSGDIIENTEETVENSSSAEISGSSTETEVVPDSDSDAIEAASTSTEEDTGLEVYSGEFSASVTDANGNTVNSWYDETTDDYYLFLTSACTISSLEVSISGVDISEVSAGTYDSETKTLTGAFAASGDTVMLTARSETTSDDTTSVDTQSIETTYDLIVMQSGLASVNITLNGTDLATINSGSKDTKYKNNSVVITDSTGTVNAQESESVEIKGRGNTTWGMSEKKPYQIKFDSKTNVLGMGKAKKWILLANSFDDSLIRNQVAFYMAQSIGMEYVTEYQFVDLWIDGEYLGTYMLGEKVELGGNRIDLSDDYGILTEVDDAFYAEEDYYFYDEYLGTWITGKEYNTEDDAGTAQTTALNQFKSKLDEFLNYLFYTDSSEITVEELSNYIDVDSFAKWYIVNEFLSNVESATTSMYFYLDGTGDVIHMGPVWDFDSSSGNYNEEFNDYGLTFFMENSIIFSKLMDVSEFKDCVKYIVEEYDNALSGLSSYASSLGDSISASANMNYIRWKFLGKENQKPVLDEFASTYSEAVSNLSGWLYERYLAFEDAILSEENSVLSVSCDQSTGELSINLTGASSYSAVYFAVWSIENGQDDIKWYTASKTGSLASAVVDAYEHTEDGICTIHAYGSVNGSMTMLAWKNVYVRKQASSVEAEVIDGTNLLNINVNNTGTYSSISAAVWGSSYGQNDLQWYSLGAGSKDTLNLTCDLGKHGETGIYNIHIYGTSSTGEMKFLCSAEVNIEELITVDVSVSTLKSGYSERAYAYNADGYDQILFAVWASVNGQNDIIWYNGISGNNYFYTDIILSDHKETGIYNVHVYGVKNGVYSLLGKKEFSVDSVNSPVVELNTTTSRINAVCSYADEYTGVTFAVWTSENGQDDLVWYSGTKNSSGWTCTVYPRYHGGNGTYNVHVYGYKNGVFTNIANTDTLIDSYSDVTLSASRTEDTNKITVTASGVNGYSNVKAAVWFSVNGQNDIVWYDMNKNSSGTSALTVNFSEHGETGELNIHLYGIINGKYVFLGSTVLEIDEYAEPVLKALNTTSKLVITLKNAEYLSDVQFPVWTIENGQDDIVWYKAQKNSSGTWVCKVYKSDHADSSADYAVHAYGYKNNVFSYIEGITVSG